MIFRLTVNDVMNDNEFSIRTYNMNTLSHYLELLDNLFKQKVDENLVKVDMNLPKESERSE